MFGCRRRGFGYASASSIILRDDDSIHQSNLLTFKTDKEVITSTLSISFRRLKLLLLSLEAYRKYTTKAIIPESRLRDY